MTRDEALRGLGLSDGASDSDIQAAVQAKLKQLAEQQAAAPTEALKAKFAAVQTKVQEMGDFLLGEGTAAPNDAATDPDETPPSSEQSPSSAPPRARTGPSLSQTKMADLPFADPRNTGLGEDGKAELNIAPGTVLSGRYTVEEQIGAGGMGAVYRATDANTGKEMAIKVLLPALLSSNRALERFLDEARISQQLSHPHIVNVYDVQQDGDFHFLTMELLEGQDLRQVMDAKTSAGQVFGIDEVREVLNAVCDGLAYAHQHTVHRDIKPENIWLTEDGEYKIMDFGIAQAQSASQRTKTGAAMGTAYYMAPEQLKGSKEIDGRADQYALAVLAYEMLTGEVPAGMIEPVTSHRKDVPRGLADAIHKALSPNQANRFATITEFREAINSNKAGLSLPSLPWKPIGISVAAVMLIGVLVGAFAGNGSMDDFWDAIRIYSEEEVLAMQRKASSIEGQARTTERRLSEYRSDVEMDIRETQSEIRRLENSRNRTSSTDKKIQELSVHLENLQTQRSLLRDYVVESDFAGELAGRLGLAKTLLQDKKYKKAMAEYDLVDAGYDKLEAALEPSAPLSINLADTNYVKDQWQALRAKVNPGQIPFADELADRYEAGLQMMRDVEFLDASSHFAVMTKDYQRLNAAVTEGKKYRSSATKAKADWEAYAGKHKIQTRYTDEYAKQFAATEKQWAAGQVVPGSEGFANLYADYLELKDAAQNSRAYRQRAANAKRSWEQYASSNKLTISLTDKYAKTYAAADAQMSKGNLVESAKGFADLVKQYGELEATAKGMVSAARSAYQGRDTLAGMVKKGTARDGTATSAKKQLAQGDKEWKAGSWTKATETYRSALAGFNAQIRKVNDHVKSYNENFRQWQDQVASLKKKIDGYEDDVDDYRSSMSRYSRDMNKSCSESGWGAVSRGLNSASCEMGCNKQVWNGYYMETKTDTYCVNSCRNQAAAQQREINRKVERCESSRDSARRSYNRADSRLDSARSKLSSARSQLKSLEASKPSYSPI